MHVEPKIEFHVGAKPTTRYHGQYIQPRILLSEIGLNFDQTQSHSLDSTLPHPMDQSSNECGCYKVVTILEP